MGLRALPLGGAGKPMVGVCNCAVAHPLLTRTTGAEHVLGKALSLRVAALDALVAGHVTRAGCNMLVAETCAVLLSRPDVLAGTAQLVGVEAVREQTSTDSDQVCVLLMELFLRCLLSVRETQLVLLGRCAHPQAAATLADLSQALSMLLAQGVVAQPVLEEHFGSVASAGKLERACRDAVRDIDRTRGQETR